MSNNIETFTREQMRTKAEANKNKNNVYGLIDRAAADGRTSMMYVGTMPEVVRVSLINNGFTLYLVGNQHTIIWD